MLNGEVLNNEPVKWKNVDLVKESDCCDEIDDQIVVMKLM